MHPYSRPFIISLLSLVVTDQRGPTPLRVSHLLSIILHLTNSRSKGYLPTTYSPVPRLPIPSCLLTTCGPTLPTLRYPETTSRNFTCTSSSRSHVPRHYLPHHQSSSHSSPAVVVSSVSRRLTVKRNKREPSTKFSKLRITDAHALLHTK